jgi:hypothetical protein
MKAEESLRLVSRRQESSIYVPYGSRYMKSVVYVLKIIMLSFYLY